MPRASSRIGRQSKPLTRALDLLTYLTPSPTAVADLAIDPGMDAAALTDAMATLHDMGINVCEEAGFVWVDRRHWPRAQAVAEKHVSHA
jgi:DNA-binding IclR family transcriptional regulator